MRLLLVLLLIHALVPAFGEAVESVVHYVTTGHLAHSDDDEGDLGDQGGEHGCCPTQHRCDCCAPQPVVASRTGQPLKVTWSPGRPAPVETTRAATRAPDRPFRPPIA